MPQTRTTTLVTIDQFPCAAPLLLMPPEGEFWLWRSRSADETWLGFGAARETTQLAECRQWLERLDEYPLPFRPRCFGALAFDERADWPPEWTGFRSRRFVLPRTLVRWARGTATVLHLADPRVLEQRDHHDAETTAAVRRERAGFGAENWRRAVGAALAEFENGELDKVVIAERFALEFSARLAPLPVMAALSRVADSAVFAHRGSGAGVFVGATPERLFRLRGRELEVDSLAGTRPRGATVNEDDRLALDLEHSGKERREQSYVTTFLRSQLANLCEQLSEDTEPVVRRLAHVQHLQTRLRGILHAGISPDWLLNALHPTPAVCGYPVPAARDWIRAHEPHGRGLYAGAIGWIDTHEAEFMVAIRSGLIHGDRAYLYAGAGVVPGSQAEAEYAECGWKAAGMRAALGI